MIHYSVKKKVKNIIKQKCKNRGGNQRRLDKNSPTFGNGHVRTVSLGSNSFLKSESQLFSHNDNKQHYHHCCVKDNQTHIHLSFSWNM